jgi:AcrR family transcriptional regulator
MTTGALHHHFATKDDLMLGVLEEAAATIRRRFQERDYFTEEGTIDTAALLKHLWTVYGDKAYWATWEIIIGTRSDARVHPQVVAHRKLSMDAILQPWLGRHVLSEEHQAEVTALLEFLLIAIRGLSLERFLDKDEAYFERNLKILAELASPRLAALTRATASQ